MVPMNWKDAEERPDLLTGMVKPIHLQCPFLSRIVLILHVLLFVLQLFVPLEAES